MPITIELGLADEERNQLAGILKCSPGELDATLEPYARSALEEYGRMFIGQRVFTRGADIQVYRLFLLIKGPFDNQIPDEQIVSDLFQTTANQSRSLKAAAEREQARRARAAARKRTSRRRRARSDYEAWLDEHDARLPLTRADLHSQSDERAARVVADGGGVQAVIEATGLRTLENVVGLIDRAILKRALDNDVLERAQQPPV